MAEKKLDELDKVNEALSTSEQFLEKYQKPILIGLLVVVLAVSGVLAFRQFYLIPRAEKAQAEMYQAVMALEEGNYDLAVAGDENFLGLEAIADQYGSTEAGNLAKAYLCNGSKIFRPFQSYGRSDRPRRFGSYRRLLSEYGTI